MSTFKCIYYPATEELPPSVYYFDIDFKENYSYIDKNECEQDLTFWLGQEAEDYYV